MSDFASLLETLLKNRVGGMSGATDNSMANNFGAGPQGGQKPTGQAPNYLQAPYNPAAQFAPQIDMNGKPLLGKGGSLKGGGLPGGGT